MRIEGSTILITGAASGIGLECARHLSSLGASIVALDNDRTALDSLAAGVDLGVNGRVRYCDVSDLSDVSALAAEVISGNSTLDALVNNAAILKDQTLVSRLGKKIKKHSVEDWLSTLSTNLTGTFQVTREIAAKWLENRQRGVVVNTSSVVRTGNPGQSAYSASKAAIDALTVTWSQELAPYKIRVASIAYGFAETGMTRRVPPLFVDRIKCKSTVGRFATVHELAEGVRFILENDYFAGRTLELDGGLRF